MSVQLTEPEAPVVPPTSTGVLPTPALKRGTIKPSHPLDPLSPDEVTPPELCRILFCSEEDVVGALRLPQYP
jgi:hypothetical protein